MAIAFVMATWLRHTTRRRRLSHRYRTIPRQSCRVCAHTLTDSTHTAVASPGNPLSGCELRDQIAHISWPTRRAKLRNDEQDCHVRQPTALIDFSTLGPCFRVAGYTICNN